MSKILEFKVKPVKAKASVAELLQAINELNQIQERIEVIKKDIIYVLAALAASSSKGQE